MANITKYLENKLITHSVGDTAYSMPTTYVGLFIIAPTSSYTSESPTGAEVGSYDHGYSRIASSSFGWTNASDGSVYNTSSITWNSSTGAWGQTTNASSGEPITHVGIFDNADVSGTKAGNLLWFGPLSAFVTISTAGDSFEIGPHNLVLTLS